MRTAVIILAGVIGFLVSAAETGRPSPAFTIQRAGKPPLPLSQYRGKVVALAFIHTTCPHCQALTAVLNSLAKDYTARGVQFLECAFNFDAETTMPEFIQRFHPAFPVGWNSEAAVRNYLQYTIMDPRPLYVPHMVFLDQRGVIRRDCAGESGFFQNADANIRAELDKMLKAAGRGATSSTAAN